MIAKSAGASADVRIETQYGVTINDPTLTEKMLPSLRKAVGVTNVSVGPKSSTSEDFSSYQELIPGLFFYVGITPKGTDPEKTATNHSPRFYVDEAGLLTGVKVMTQLAVDYLQMAK